MPEDVNSTGTKATEKGNKRVGDNGEPNGDSSGARAFRSRFMDFVMGGILTVLFPGLLVLIQMWSNQNLLQYRMGLLENALQAQSAKLDQMSREQLSRDQAQDERFLRVHPDGREGR